jgi:hypothetical protein
MTFEFRPLNNVVSTQGTKVPGLASGDDLQLELIGQQCLSGSITRVPFDIAPNAPSLGVR